MNKLGKCILSTIESDSHMWNLVYMQLVLEECGYETLNLGCCVSEQETIQTVKKYAPDLVVISTLNGHGYVQGRSLVENYRKSLGNRGPTIVIGGNLSTQISTNAELGKDLVQAGYDAVFTGSGSIEAFHKFIDKQKAIKMNPRVAS